MENPAWKTMESAPKELGLEIIAARFGRYDDLTAMCEKSPFVSFWMPTRRKYYGEPTHWLCCVPLVMPPVSEIAADSEASSAGRCPFTLELPL